MAESNLRDWFQRLCVEDGNVVPIRSTVDLLAVRMKHRNEVGIRQFCTLHLAGFRINLPQVVVAEVHLIGLGRLQPGQIVIFR